jgi:hypothetical protein
MAKSASSLNRRFARYGTFNIAFLLSTFPESFSKYAKQYRVQMAVEAAFKAKTLRIARIGFINL